MSEKFPHEIESFGETRWGSVVVVHQINSRTGFSSVFHAWHARVYRLCLGDEFDEEGDESWK